MNREYKTRRHTGSDLQKNIQELFFNEIIKDKKKKKGTKSKQKGIKKNYRKWEDKKKANLIGI